MVTTKPVVLLETDDIVYVSQRELEVVREVARGKSNQEVGEALDISERTVQAHLGNLFNKLQMEGNRTNLVINFLKRGWLKLEEI